MSSSRPFPVSFSFTVFFLFVVVLILGGISAAQIAHPEQLQVKPPMLGVDPPAAEATAADLEDRADALRAAKLYLDALDYYQAALQKAPHTARLLNKIGITELLMERYRDARKSFEFSIKADHKFADAYNNLGVVLYEERKYGAAIKQYRSAIAIDEESASFFCNLGAAYFSKKDFDPAVVAYEKALALDPDVFQRSSRGGVQAKLPSPEDRARYNYTVAKLYAKMGLSDRALEYLRKAMEDGYRDMKNVYKDQEFSEVRKDPRFTELMATKPTVIPD